MELTREKTIPAILTGIIVILLISSLFLVKTNNTKKEDLMTEKLKSEKLLSEKLSVEKDLEKIKAEFTRLKGKSESTDKLLAEAEIKLTEKEKRINSLLKERNSYANAKKELAVVMKLKADVEKDYAQLKMNLEKAEAQNKTLQTNVAALESANKDLLSKLAQQQLYKADNFQVNASRSIKKEKLTVRAGLTKKLSINFEVPGSLTEKISFKIVTPSGKTINSDDNSLSWLFVDDPRNLTASLSPITGAFEESRKVEMTYAPKEKLEKGVYKIAIMSNGINIGSFSVKFK